MSDENNASPSSSSPNGKIDPAEIAKLKADRESTEKNLQIRARFVVIGAGILNLPKLPNTPGILEYQGEVFHSYRWAYDVTGGSPQKPSLSLSKLKDKRVAIIGTGSTGVQLVPQLARSAKHLYVVQRTPANEDDRDQRETDEECFHKVTQSPNWQRERMRNFHQFSLLARPRN
ncbi:hypothetical protein N7478_007277 [Penicillium angulare]|uniref:uncharacterized protein n=1 Tax=Penicillium angulare TaxID=116970 RepID=UPI002541158E|nr:uncharacterized protein N7478_007277 [Penicillium angulare]KAJ5281905.1 hypothetical protein N7478_007277 [Penicillium angulare]